MRTRLISQGGDDTTDTLDSALRDELDGDEFDRLDVAVAYATKAGLKSLRQSIGSFPNETRWLIGLDDAISQPEALEKIAKLEGSSLLLSSLADEGRRFHPKLYLFHKMNDQSSALLLVGSGNMTLNGLRKNAEVAVSLRSETEAETNELKEVFENLWSLGFPMTKEVLETYRAKHKAARKARKKITNTGFAPPEPRPDEPVPVPQQLSGNPETATVAWLEAGSATAQGREVEFPRAMTPFFGITQETGSPINLVLNHESGNANVNLTMREDNAMWRIGFSSAFLQMAIGRQTLRPIAGGNRSDLAVKFTKVGDVEYEIDFVSLGSSHYAKLEATSNSVDSLFRTMKSAAGRQFGFY